MGTNRSENIVVDGAVPSGNIIVEGVAGDEVRLRQDMRDSADWFYWGDEKMNAAKRRWGEWLEKFQDGALDYRVADNFPWNFGWNAPSNIATGQRAAGTWAVATQRAPRLVSSYEVPFANANGKTVTPEACRAFGRASARVLRAFLEE